MRTILCSALAALAVLPAVANDASDSRGSWRDVAPMNVGRGSGFMVVLKGGRRAFAFGGGTGPDGAPAQNGERFDLDAGPNGTWTQTPGLKTAGNGGVYPANAGGGWYGRLADGTVLITGGYENPASYIYDPDADVWHTTALASSMGAGVTWASVLSAD